jgi:two-component sensor histidine kinase
MHRSYCFLKLTLALHERPLREPGRSLTCNTELCLATDLAALYRSLAIGPERQVVPCSSVLRDVVRNLVALFGSIVGDVELHVNIERVALPAFQRRALVLAASELVINALCHAFRARTYGRILLELHAIDIWKARLQVSDDGVGCDDRQIDTGRGIAGGLASLLGSELAYRTRNGHGTTAELMLSLLL